MAVSHQQKLRYCPIGFKACLKVERMLLGTLAGQEFWGREAAVVAGGILALTVMIWKWTKKP